MKAFEIGHQYSCRSLCDYECIWTYTVTARTAKFVTLRDEYGEVKRAGIRMWDDVEACSPHGRYSMSPTLRADKVAM